MMSNELPKMWTGRFVWPLLVLASALCSVLDPLHAQTMSPQPFVANDRLELLPLTHSLKVAEPNDIPLYLSGTNVKSVIVDWGIYPPGSSTPMYAQEPTSPKYNLLPGSNGSSMLHFTPSVLGKLSLGIIVFFQDGGFARKNEDVETVLPDRLPENFIIQQGNHPWNTDRLYATVDHPVWLDTAAYYSGFDKPIHVPATNVVFQVLNDPGKEPLQLNPTTGRIKPVTTGRALIQADFAGLTTFTCILVFPSLGGGGVDDCHDLLPPGKSLPPQPKFAPPKIITGSSPTTSR